MLAVDVFALVAAGHDVYFEQEAGAFVVDSVAQVFPQCDMIVKIKEPMGSECRMIRGKIIKSGVAETL